MESARSPSIHRFAPHEWRIYRDLRLRALADSPDAFGSTFERENARPDAEWVRRLKAGAQSPTDLPLTAWVGEKAVGLAWAWIRHAEPEVAHLFQVWVAPEHRGRGIARMLLDAVASWAREAGARHVALDVTCGDSSAMRLYIRGGIPALRRSAAATARCTAPQAAHAVGLEPRGRRSDR